MKRLPGHTKLFAAVALLFLTLSNYAHACSIDHASSSPQFGAASNVNLGSPINGPTVCGGSPVSATHSQSIGTTGWSGTGYGNLGSISSDYWFFSGSGWYGSAPASMGLFYIGDLMITGGPVSTINASVNAAYGGTAGNDFIPDTQSLAWAVKLFDESGFLIDEETTSPSIC